MAVSRFTRVTSHFNAFRENNSLVDLVLVSGKERYPCHRIQLASVSQWFESELSKPENAVPFHSTTPLELPLPENPGGHFADFLNFVYTGEANIVATKIPSLLKIAVFYGATEHVKIFRFFLHEFAKETARSTLITLVGQLDVLGLWQEAIIFLDELAKGVAAIISHSTVSVPFTLPSLYSAVSPPLFAAILNHKEVAQALAALAADDGRASNENRLAEEIASITDDYYDVYTKGGRQLTEADRRALASTYDWADVGNLMVNRRAFVQHRCEWLPAETALALQSSVLDARRRIRGKFKQDIGRTGTGPVSRWFLLAWLANLRNAKLSGRPVVDIIHFISTVGGIAKPIAPHKFGFLSVVGRGEPLGSLYDASKTFESDKYFLGVATPGESPGVVVDFYNARIAIESVSVDTTVPKKSRNTPAYKCPDPASKPQKYKVTIEWGVGKLDATKQIEIDGKTDVSFDADGKPKASKIAVTFPQVVVLNKAVPSVPQPVPVVPIARLNALEFSGTFDG